MIKYEYNGNMIDIIPLNEIEIGVYNGMCRNATHAYWNGERFTYLRTKWNHTFLEEIEHPENDYQYDVFLPFEKMGEDEEHTVRLMNAIKSERIEKQ